MKKNVGQTDKIVRYIIGILAIIGAIFFGIAGNTLWTIISAIVAVIAIATAFMNFCAIYAIFGISTCPAEK